MSGAPGSPDPRPIARDMTELVGRTPMVFLNRLAQGLPGRVAAKLEFYNPCSSVKDRIAKNMIEMGLADGRIRPDTLIVEPTSGNTGIGLAFVCAVKGLQLVLTMPASMSVERRKLLAGLGAELVLTDAAKGMKGAIAKAEEIVARTPGSFMPMQFANPANPATHVRTTAEELWADVGPDSPYELGAFVCGVGTGGTVTGTGTVLKARNPEVHIAAVEPETSAVLSGKAPGPHSIQGIGAGFVPEVVDRSVIDEIITVSDQDALATAKRLIREEGILCGISSGASCLGALNVAARPEMAGKIVVFVAHDTAERYLSTDLFEEE